MGAAASGLLLGALHVGVFGACHALSQAFAAARGLAVLLLGPAQAPPPQRLDPPKCQSPGALQELPVVPLPRGALAAGSTLAFEPCSNLCIYNFGAAACLQRSDGWAEVQPSLRFAGTSSGSLVAAYLALGVDICSVFPECVGMLAELNARPYGWIGAYSRTIGALAHKGWENRQVKDINQGQLRITTTRLAPLPVAHDLDSFQSGLDLEQAVLASCYIPVVWEKPIWLPWGVGPCLDGGVTCFLQDADFVFGPYHSNMPEVGPAVEYTRKLVFQPVSEPDMYRLFEDGYHDCAAWLRRGCPNRQAERAELLAGVSSGPLGGLRVLAAEGAATLLEVCGLRNKGGAA